MSDEINIGRWRENIEQWRNGGVGEDLENAFKDELQLLDALAAERAKTKRLHEAFERNAHHWHKQQSHKRMLENCDFGICQEARIVLAETRELTMATKRTKGDDDACTKR